MKGTIDLSVLQQYVEQELYKQVESCIRSDDLDGLKKICSENTVDFTHDSGFLGILAAGKSKILHYICEQSPDLVNLHGIDILTAAIWAQNESSAHSLTAEYHVDYTKLEGTDAYDYYVEMTGEQHNNQVAEVH